MSPFSLPRWCNAASSRVANSAIDGSPLSHDRLGIPVVGARVREGYEKTGTLARWDGRLLLVLT